VVRSGEGEIKVNKGEIKVGIDKRKSNMREDM